MNKELEEVIDNIKNIIEIFYEFPNPQSVKIKDCEVKNLETVLNYIENSIPKEVIIDKILERKFELQQEYKDFEDDIQLNTLQKLLEGK